MDVNYLLFDFPGMAGVHCLFHGRSCAEKAHNDLAGSISLKNEQDRENALQTRRRLFTVMHGLGMDCWTECNQTHGTVLVPNPEPLAIGQIPNVDADGMMTARKGLGLLIKTADCQAILLADQAGEHVMAIHAGWRGNRASFPQKAVQAFCGQYEIRPEEIMAVRGPSLGPDKAEFVNFESEWGKDWEQWRNPKTNCMNLWALTRWQLEQAGLRPKNIYGLDICTMTNHERYFSWRHDKSPGRQASVIWMEKRQPC